MWEVSELILQPGQVQGLRGGCREVVRRAGAWPGSPEFTSQLPWLWPLKQLVASRALFSLPSFIDSKMHTFPPCDSEVETHLSVSGVS